MGGVERGAWRVFRLGRRIRNDWQIRRLVADVHGVGGGACRERGRRGGFVAHEIEMQVVVGGEVARNGALEEAFTVGQRADILPVVAHINLIAIGKDHCPS